MKKVIMIVILLATYICSKGTTIENPNILFGGRIGYTMVMGLSDGAYFRNIVAAKGGNHSIQYGWEKKTTIGDWQTIPNSGNKEFGMSELQETTWFRRKATDGNQVAYSNTVTAYKCTEEWDPVNINVSSQDTIIVNVDRFCKDLHPNWDEYDAFYNYCITKPENAFAQIFPVPLVGAPTYMIELTPFFNGRTITATLYGGGSDWDGLNRDWSKIIRLNQTTEKSFGSMEICYWHEDGYEMYNKTVDEGTSIRIWAEGEDFPGEYNTRENLSVWWQYRESTRTGWESDNTSNNNYGKWINVLKTVNYDTEPLFKNMEIRRCISDGLRIAYSNTFPIKIAFSFIEGGEIEGNQTIKFWETPGALQNKVLASGGFSDEIAFEYIWEYSTDGVSWIQIPESLGHTSYQPKCSRTTHYRRIAKKMYNSSCSNIITIKVELNGGSIYAEHNADNNTINIKSALAAQGCSGEYNYQWMISPVGCYNWINITGANSESYQCPRSTSPNSYRRKVTCGGNTEYSNITSYLGSDENYIVKSINKGNTSKENATYYDGLGRQMQQVAINAGGNNSGNIITPIIYDDLGRDDTRSYLPYVSNSTEHFHPIALAEQQHYYKSRFPGEIPYTEKIYEKSPLNRVLELYNVGKIYRDSSRTVKYNYRTNAQGELPIISSQNQIIIEFKGFYKSGIMYCNSSINEDNVETINYTDVLGRTIMTRTKNNANNVDTYYVYNDNGLLQAVLSPMAMKAILNSGNATYSISDDLIKKYCFYYVYDNRGNVIERQLPGTEIEYLVYDKRDRLVLNQNGNLRRQNRWLYNVYDNFNRLAAVSLVDQNALLTRQDIQSRYNAASFDISYPTLGGTSDLYKPFANNDFALVAVLSENKYDRQGNYFTIPDYLCAKPIAGITTLSQIDDRTTGLKIYDKFAILNGDNYDNLAYIERAYYYDYKDRIVQIVEKNQLDGISRLSYKYDFTGNILFKQESHQAGQDVVTDLIETNYTYDNQDRLLHEQATLNNGTPAVTNYNYDELGQLITKSYGEQPGKAKVKLNKTHWLKVDKSKQLKTNWSISDIMIYGSSSNFIDYDVYDYVIADNDIINPQYFICADGFNPRIEYYYIPQMEKLNQQIITWAISMYSDFTWDKSPKIEVVSIPFPGAGTILSEVELNRESSGTGSIEVLKYNIQGWLTNKLVTQGADHRLFEMKLHYYDPRYLGTNPSYTGNISEWSWQHDSESKNAYSFFYDPLNRLVDSKQYINDLITDRFVEKGLTYDYNGNILTLQRTKGGKTENNFAYTFSGNQLVTLADTILNESYHYSYDANGNMIEDGAYGLLLSYNHLNQIEKVEQNGLSLAKYTYLSDGTKLSATNVDDYGLAYLGSLVYLKYEDDYALESAAFSNGRFIETSSGNIPNYFITDHLGSTRVVVNSQGQVQENNDYYPFGLRWNTGLLSDNRYRYNGKEEQSFVNVPYADYGARVYDAKYRLGWNSIDPLMEQRLPFSPYSFNQNNPINRVDMNGMLDDEWAIISGPDYKYPQLTWISDNGGDQTQYVHSYWDSGSGELWNLGLEIWEHWPNNEAGMLDILSGGDAALGSWNTKWWENASGRIEQSSINPVDLLTIGYAATKAFTKSLVKYTTVGRWMSKAEYNAMLKTGRVVEGPNGQTFVATGGATSYRAAKSGSVYAEFKVPTNSLVQGGREDWFKLIGPNAKLDQISTLQKHGGEFLPRIKNLSIKDIKTYKK